jgi:hypothetical protein
MNTKFGNKGKFIFFPVIALAFVFAAGGAVMLLWNSILPEVITAVRPVTYAQAVGILVLARILFGGFRGRSGYGKNGMNKALPPWREKMMNMSEEEREKFKSEWRDRCGRK